MDLLNYFKWKIFGLTCYKVFVLVIVNLTRKKKKSLQLILKII